MLRFLVLVTMFCAAGCSGSRWARSDPDYAEKYSEHSDNPIQMAKQAIDARHLEQKFGKYFAAGAQPHPSAVNAEFGRMTYVKPWLEEQIAIAGLFSDDLDDVFLGGKIGARVQTPSRVAPFVGVGGFAGLLHKGSAYDAAWLLLSDDEDDGSPGDDALHPMFAVYPEAGMHVWLDGEVRLTASVSYNITTEGRDHDYLFINFGVAQLDRDDFFPKKKGQRHFSLPPSTVSAERERRAAASIQRLPPTRE